METSFDVSVFTRAKLWQMAADDSVPLFAVAYDEANSPIGVVVKSDMLFQEWMTNGLLVSKSLQETLHLAKVTTQSRVITNPAFITALFDAFVYHRNEHPELEKYKAISWKPIPLAEALR